MSEIVHSQRLLNAATGVLHLLAVDKRAAVLLHIPTSDAELGAVRALFQEYAASLKIDLCFQDFDNELRELPGDYCGPRGALIVATVQGHYAGCCAMRPLDASDYPNACEMKRLFVRDAWRGLGVGRKLAEGILDAARMAGYDCILLDTLNEMETARALYEDLGFVEVPPYYYNPIPGAHYLRAEL